MMMLSIFMVYFLSQLSGLSLLVIAFAWTIDGNTARSEGQ